MPKVSEGFHAQKREEILDAAQRIAMEKPLPHVSMKDLICACGVSQGAIYHYFSGLDEIWLGLVERFYRADDVLEHLLQVFSLELSPGETACRSIEILCENLHQTIPAYGKLILELNTLVQTNPQQYAFQNRPGVGRLDEMLALFESWCEKESQRGRMHPRVSRQQLSHWLSATYLGLRYQAICLQIQCSMTDLELAIHLSSQGESWKLSCLYLLGIEHSDYDCLGG